MAFYVKIFQRHFRDWVAAVCGAWDYSLPNEPFYQRVRERLTDPTLEWIGYGVEAGLILEHGFQFDVIGNAPSKGAYKWLSQRSGATEPQCNWEYYVQVAFFARLWEPCQKAALRLTFEDELMDLAVRRHSQLLWCIEVKEQAPQLEQLLAEIKSHGARVDLEAPDRGNDPLRKAKYLMRHRPESFSGVAIGVQRDFQVLYEGKNAFCLEEANPPLDALSQPPSRGP